MTSAEATPRERGWRRLLLGVAIFLFVPAVPQLRALVPIEQTLLLLVPAVAVCAWLGWRSGGRLWFAVAVTAVALWLLTRPVAGGAAYAGFARGWALVLAAGFGVIAFIAGDRPFFTRALGTVALSGAACALVLAVAGVGHRRVERVIAAELSDRVESSIANLRARTATPEWRELERKNPDGVGALVRMMEEGEKLLRKFVPIGATLFPAILAFESLAALGLAWSLYHRLSRARLGRPLAALREFRFEDQFVWVVIAGLVMVLLPAMEATKSIAAAVPAVRDIGVNLLVFFGALYALRGLGVMTWFLVTPGRWVGIAFITLICLIPPGLALPLGIGLSDTWFDWRRRSRAPQQGAETNDGSNS